MDRALFAASHYGALLLFALACWGIGAGVIRKFFVTTQVQRWLAHGLSLSAGVGIVICAIQVLAVAGLLSALWLFALLASGWAAALWHLFQAGALVPAGPATPAGFFWRLHWTVWLLLLLALGVLLFPLRPPNLGDELMYHLPHAAQWANSGELRINEWLRYPYFPYNYDLLYAAALVLYDDVMPHLLHAFAGLTSAWLLYQLALRQTSRVTACMAAIAWLALVRGEFGAAYVDLALAMFLLAGWIGLLLWREATPPRSIGWAVFAAFMFGVALGIKYQMLGFLPFFMFVLLLRERRPKALLLAFAAGLLPCTYWYLRNALLTGDPFNPLGGPLFGFHDWNQADLQYQLKALRDVRDWPHWLLWPAIAAPLLPSVWRSPGLRLTMAFSAYAFVIWWVTSHYARYLLPVYPMLLVLAGHVTVVCIVSGTSGLCRLLNLPAHMAPHHRRQVQGVFAAFLLLLALLTTLRSLTRDWDQVAATPAQRDAYLASHLWEYKETLDFLSHLPGARIYQFGMEGVLYYAPQPIYGDHFGRWRYNDFMTLTPPELAARLNTFGLNTLALRIEYSKLLLQHNDLLRCFDLIHQTQTFRVFNVRSNGACSDRPTGSAEPLRP